MRKIIYAAGFALGLLIPSTAQESSWLTDFEAAKAAAKKHDKPILVDFTGSDWCGWCIKLKDEVFSKKEFEKWAADRVVLLELDFPRRKQLPAKLKEQNEKLRKQFNVRGFPTILFLDAEGKQIGKSGYMKGGPKAWIANAEQQLPKSGATEDAWMTDYKAALKKAKKEKKLVLADFTGSDWCGWCIRLKDEVFSTKEFQEWAADHVVLLELDFPRRKQLPPELKKQNDELRKEHGVRGYPTILFLDPKGKKVGKSGYVRGGPTAWIAAVEKELGKKLKKRKSKKRRSE